jgi:hypothetical protein
MISDAKERKNEILALKVRHETEKKTYQEKFTKMKQDLEQTE